MFKRRNKETRREKEKKGSNRAQKECVSERKKLANKERFN